MASLGSHLLIDMWGVDRGLLDDADRLRGVLEDCARQGGAEVVETRVHHFAPQGLSGMVILRQSHLAVHTWPELGFLAADVFTCGEPLICRGVARALLERLEPTRRKLRGVERGTTDDESSRHAC